MISRICAYWLLIWPECSPKGSKWVQMRSQCIQMEPKWMQANRSQMAPNGAQMYSNIWQTDQNSPSKTCMFCLAWALEANNTRENTMTSRICVYKCALSASNVLKYMPNRSKHGVWFWLSKLPRSFDPWSKLGLRFEVRGPSEIRVRGFGPLPGLGFEVWALLRLGFEILGPSGIRVRGWGPSEIRVQDFGPF